MLIPGTFQALERTVPPEHPGTVAAAAGAVYLLCRPEADDLTGEVLTCGRGRKMS